MTAGVPNLPPNPTPEDIRRVVNAALAGGLNIGGSVTLDAGDSTTVTDARVSGSSRIVLWPTNEDAALLLQTTQVYTSAKDKGTFTLTHVGAAGIETFDYAAFG